MPRRVTRMKRYRELCRLRRTLLANLAVSGCGWQSRRCDNAFEGLPSAEHPGPRSDRRAGGLGAGQGTRPTFLPKHSEARSVSITALRTRIESGCRGGIIRERPRPGRPVPCRHRCGRRRSGFSDRSPPRNHPASRPRTRGIHQGPFESRRRLGPVSRA